jgi:transcriptional antiterminator RfaH
MAWYVLRTKPRQEKRAQENLKAWQLETLLPVFPDQRRHPRPGDDGLRVLFPSYIFCRFPAFLFDKVKFTYGISYIVGFGGTPAVVDQAIIDQLIERMHPDGTVVEAPESPSGFEIGDKVLIQEGPFANFVGVFERDLPGSERVRILLNTVAMRASVECLSSGVRKVE